MKKFLIITVALISSTAFMSSCKKDYTCTCKDGTTALQSYTYKDSKKNATETCSNAESTFKMGYPNAKCELK